MHTTAVRDAQGPAAPVRLRTRLPGECVFLSPFARMTVAVSNTAVLLWSLVGSHRHVQEGRDANSCAHAHPLQVALLQSELEQIFSQAPPDPRDVVVCCVSACVRFLYCSWLPSARDFVEALSATPAADGVCRFVCVEPQFGCTGLTEFVLCLHHSQANQQVRKAYKRLRGEESGDEAEQPEPEAQARPVEGKKIAPLAS